VAFSNLFISATEELEHRRGLICRRREILQQTRALHERDQQVLIDRQSEIEQERYVTAVNCVSLIHESCKRKHAALIASLVPIRTTLLQTLSSIFPIEPLESKDLLSPLSLSLFPHHFLPPNLDRLCLYPESQASTMKRWRVHWDSLHRLSNWYPRIWAMPSHTQSLALGVGASSRTQSVPDGTKEVSSTPFPFLVIGLTWPNQLPSLCQGC
jgi:hypothetical protein